MELSSLASSSPPSLCPSAYIANNFLLLPAMCLEVFPVDFHKPHHTFKYIFIKLCSPITHFEWVTLSQQAPEWYMEQLWGRNMNIFTYIWVIQRTCDGLVMVSNWKVTEQEEVSRMIFQFLA